MARDHGHNTDHPIHWARQPLSRASPLGKLTKVLRLPDLRRIDLLANRSMETQNRCPGSRALTQWVDRDKPRRLHDTLPEHPFSIGAIDLEQARAILREANTTMVIVAPGTVGISVCGRA